MPEICLTPPSGECIHVEEARNDRRIDDHEDDTKIKSLIVAARQAAESKTRQQLLHARWQLTLDAFPCAIRLPHSPLVEVEKIEYLDMTGAWQTMGAGDYVVNAGLMPAVVAPGFGKIWPIPLPQIASVRVTYVAGYASPIATGGALAANEFRTLGPARWKVGDLVKFYNSGGVLPAPLDGDANYLIATAVAGVYTLTDDAGAPVTFARPGMGRSFIGVVPEGIRSWMLLRIGSLYENREEVAILSRGQVKDLPYVDGLLDPFMTGLY
jgi:uncharacterized phiE125 gp8 family phage protein